MTIPTAWRLHSTTIGWIVFAVLALPIFGFCYRSWLFRWLRVQQGCNYDRYICRNRVYFLVARVWIIQRINHFICSGLASCDINTGCLCSGDIIANWWIKDKGFLERLNHLITYYSPLGFKALDHGFLITQPYCCGCSL